MIGFFDPLLMARRGPGPDPDPGPSIPYTTNMLQWCRADLGVTLDGNGRVSAHADQSGHANHMAQSNTAQEFRPLLVASALNGRPALRYGPAPSGSNAQSLGCPIFQTAQDNWSWIFALTPRDMHLAIDQLLATNGPDGPRRSIQPRNASDNHLRYIFGGVASLVTSTVIASDTPIILALIRSGGVLRTWRNGVLQASTFTNTPQALSSGRFTIGATDLRGALRADLYEHAIYGEALSTTNRAAVESYLATRYAITLG